MGPLPRDQRIESDEMLHNDVIENGPLPRDQRIESDEMLHNDVIENGRRKISTNSFGAFWTELNHTNRPLSWR